MRAEDVYIYAENPHILRLHMLYSAKELPLNSNWPVSILQRDSILAMYDGRDSHISHTTNSSSNNNSSNGNSNNSNTVREMHGNNTVSKLEGEISYESYMNKEGLFDSDIDPVEFGRKMYRNTTTINNSNNNSNSNSSSSSNYVSTNSMINSSSNTGSTSSNNTNSISSGIVIEESDIWGGAETYSTVLDYLVSTQSLLPSLLSSTTTHTIYTPRPTIHSKYTNNNTNSSSGNSMFSLRVIDSITIHIHDDSRDSLVLDSIGYSRAFYEVYIGIHISVNVTYRCINKVCIYV